MNFLTGLAATACAACLAFATNLAIAQDFSTNSIIVHHPWSRPTPPGVTVGVGYMGITNRGDSAITLTGASSPRTNRVSIHESRENDGTMSMRHLSDGLTIPAGKTLAIEPLGYHLMLEKLTAPLREGERIPMTLTFESATFDSATSVGTRDLTIELEVVSLDADPPRQPTGTDHSGH